MMTTFNLADLEQQRKGIEERIHKLKDDLAITQAAIDRATADYFRTEGMIALLHAQAPDGAASDKKRTPPPPQLERIKNPTRSKVADAALAIIEARGRPIGRAELFDKVREAGIVIEGGNPSMVFSTMLWRERERIVRLRNFGYWPAKRPFPPAGYFPDGQPGLL